MASLLADVTPLREVPAFRRLWVGSLLSQTGSSMTAFAVALQVYLLTRSSFAVGVTALVSAVPGIGIGIFGGALIDAVDRRRLVLLLSGLLMGVSSLLALQAFLGGRQVWPIWLLIAVQSALAAVSGPARRTFLPHLLDRDQLPAGVALNSLAQHTAVLTGPLLAGVVVLAGGLRLCYLVDAASFTAALHGVSRLPAMPPEETATPRGGLHSVVEGFAFLRRTPLLLGALLTDANAMVLAMPVALFPAVNAERFGGSPRTLGLLSAAVALGGILGSGLSGPLNRVGAKGCGMLVAAAVWGLALAGFGLAGGLTVTLLCLTVAGAADVSSVVLRSTIIQLETPAPFRGRVNAAEFVVGATFPDVGNFRAGAVAAISSPGVSAWSGGLVSVVGTGLLALAFPAMIHYRATRRPARDPSPAELRPAADAVAGPLG